MAITRRTMLGLLVVVTAMLIGGCVGLGTVHKVGESDGWSIMGVDYATWASSKTFQVGDSLSFEYNREFHDVTQVTLQDFQSCNVPSSALARYQTGSDLVNLTTAGHYYFICGVPGHCQAGQKLDVLVLPSSLPATQPIVSPSISSPSPANAPHPMTISPNNAASASGVPIVPSLLALVLAARFGRWICLLIMF